MQAFSSFPDKAGKAQVDLISDDITGIRRVAKKNGWRLSDPKKAFLVQGSDEVGAIHKVLKKLTI